MSNNQSLFKKIDDLPKWLYMSIPFISILVGVLLILFVGRDWFTSIIASTSITYGIVVLITRFFSFLTKTSNASKVQNHESKE